MVFSFLFGSAIFWFLTLAYFGLAFVGALELWDGMESWPALRSSLLMITGIYLFAVAAVATVLIVSV